MRTSRALVLALALLAAGCTPKIRAQAPASPAASAPGGTRPSATAAAVNVIAPATARRFTTITERKGKRVIYALRSVSSTIRGVTGGSYEGTFQKPHVTFYQRDGKTLIADAPRALVLERTKAVTMNGGVHALAQDGTRLACRTLVYDGTTERIHGNGDVVLTSPRGDQLTGETIDGDVRLDDVTIRGASR